MVLTSIRPDNDIHKFPPTVIPKALTLSNYLYVFTGMKGFSRTFLNSVVVTVSTVLIVLTIPTIITFVFAWQEFMFASTINKKNNWQTLPVGIVWIRDELQTMAMGKVGAAIILSILPVIILFFVFRKFFIEGLSEGMLKG